MRGEGMTLPFSLRTSTMLSSTNTLAAVSSTSWNMES